MSQSIYILLVCFFLLVGVVGTVAVGFSKENREGNPEYERRTKGNWTRLTLSYAVAGAIGIAGLVVYIQIQ
jgi:hypothetical protein